MSDDPLLALDRAVERMQPLAASASPLRARIERVPSWADADEIVEPEWQWKDEIWMQAFFATQFLWGLPLFLPGAQNVRFLIRALPYISALVLLPACWNLARHFPRPRGAGLLAGALALLVLNLLQPASQAAAGLAHCVFQLSIAAPMFWAYKTVKSPAQVERLLISVFVMNFMSAGLGVLQVYDPDRFLPPEFSTLVTDERLTSMTYRGFDDRIIIRPPGLSDTPGGAAIAGGLTALIGLGLSLRARKTWQMGCLAGMVAVGLSAVYLTQTRSALLTAIGSAGFIAVLAVKRGRVARASQGLALGGVLAVASFFWATSVGGDTVANRFLDIRSQGALNAYQMSRGGFVEETMGEMLDRYPLGAGLGRWGMINSYFGDPSDHRSRPIYVEIQLTGWLLDGGIPMWILYGGAIAIALWSTFRRSASRDALLGEVGMMVLGVQIFIAGMSMVSPAFNTQLGILFWTLAAALHGAAVWPSRAEPPEPVHP